MIQQATCAGGRHSIPQQVVSWRATQVIYQSDDLDLGTGVQCHPWHGQHSCQFWCFCDYFVQLWANASHWRAVICYNGGDRIPSVYKDWSSQASPFRRYGAFSVLALIGMVILTFDLLTSKWGHGSPVSRAFCQFSACCALTFST